MAVLGAQIVITMVMASLMSKISPYKSFSRWILTGYSRLVRYVHPSDDELKSLVAPNGGGGGGGKARNRKHYRSQPPSSSNGNVFNVPRSLDVQLETAQVEVSDLIQLRFYAEYQWLLDFAIYAVLVYSLTEVSFVLAVLLFGTCFEASIFFILEMPFPGKKIQKIKS